MNSRIRYTNSRSDSNALLQSQRTFEINGVQYRVHLNTMDNTYEIHNDTTGQVAVRGSGKSLHSVKIGAKQGLKSLGFNFTEEKRVKSEALTVSE